MLSILAKSLKDFRIIHRKVLFFESIFILLSAFVFVPFIAFVFNRALRTISSGYLVNQEVIGFVINWKGLLILVTLGSLMTFLLFTQLGVTVVLSQKIYFGKRVGIMAALFTAIKRIPRIIGVGLIYLFLILLLVSPFLNSPLLNYILGSYNLDVLVVNPVRQSLFRIVIMLFLFLFFFLLMCRYIFALHLTLIKKYTLTYALKRSWQLTRQQLLPISVALIMLNFLVFGLAGVLLLLLNYLPIWLGFADRFIFIESAILVLSSYIGFIATIIVIPLNMIFITRLYYAISGETKDLLIVPSDGPFSRLEKKMLSFVGEHKIKVRLILFLLLATTFALNTQIYQQFVHARWHIMIAAHRGDSINSPENTLAAIENALNQSVDFIEIDVQLTADDQLVLFHDNTFKRINGRNFAVSDLSLADIKKIDAGSWFSSEFAGEPIPTLEEVINYVEDRAGLMIDVKIQKDPVRTAEVLADIVERYDLKESCLVQSFSPSFLAALRKIDPEIKIGQILAASVGNLERMDVDFFTISQRMLTENFVKKARRQNRQIWVWTVNSERNIRTVLGYDINGIVTDYPLRVRSLDDITEIIEVEEVSAHASKREIRP